MVTLLLFEAKIMVFMRNKWFLREATVTYFQSKSYGHVTGLFRLKTPCLYIIVYLLVRLFA